MASSVPKGVQEQRDYLAKLESEHFGWDLVVGEAFVRGMRDIGYKSTAFAMAELLDNSIQAGASRVDVVFGFDDGSKPTQVAVVDNGHGMEPEMVRASLIWGAGTRAQNTKGFGKYGYGLPSASISQCSRVTVYSKTAASDWHKAHLDIDEIAEGKWSAGNRIEMPGAKQGEPPAFVADFLREKGLWDDFTHGTVVVWDKLDPKRIDRRRREALRNTLVGDLGTIYRNYLVATPMTVDGENVEPCDPLFLTEGFRGYDIDGDRAWALPAAKVPVKDKETEELLGTLRIRFSRMPATFFRKPEFKKTNRPSRKDMNLRLPIADANNGIIFLRNGRQIDVVRPPRSLTKINATTDRFWAVEVDFDASLDSYFAITTAKQQVTPDERIWQILVDQANLIQGIAQMRSDYRKEAKELAAETEQQKEKKRASVAAIEGAKKFNTSEEPEDTPERQEEAAGNLEREAQQRASESGLKAEVVERELTAEREGVEYEVKTEDMPGAPFFRCVPAGGTRILYLNIAHPFYTDLYEGPGSSARLRAGLEVLLWTLGNAEVDAEPKSDRRRFYSRERVNVWSPTLADGLEELDQVSLVQDDDDERIAA